jgi:hypothetical protein
MKALEAVFFVVGITAFTVVIVAGCRLYWTISLVVAELRVALPRLTATCEELPMLIHSLRESSESVAVISGRVRSIGALAGAAAQAVFRKPGTDR